MSPPLSLTDLTIPRRLSPPGSRYFFGGQAPLAALKPPSVPAAVGRMVANAATILDNGRNKVILHFLSQVAKERCK